MSEPYGRVVREVQQHGMEAKTCQVEKTRTRKALEYQIWKYGMRTERSFMVRGA